MSDPGAVRLLAYNTQTEGPQTLAVKKAAEDAGIPVLDFSETLPDGKTYVRVDDRQRGRPHRRPGLTGWTAGSPGRPDDAA